MQLLNKTSRQLNNLEQKYIKEIRTKSNEILKLQKQIVVLRQKIDEINKVRPQVLQRETQEYELKEKAKMALASPVSIIIAPNEPIDLKAIAQKSIKN